MSNATNTLQATITSTDPNGNTSINRGLGNPSLAGAVCEAALYQLLPAADQAITLPASPIYNIYVKNNAAAGSGITIIVKLTPNGGAQQVLAKLEPGGVFLWWNVINTDANGGYTALTLTASGANTPVEYILGA